MTSACPRFVLLLGALLSACSPTTLAPSATTSAMVTPTIPSTLPPVNTTPTVSAEVPSLLVAYIREVSGDYRLYLATENREPKAIWQLNQGQRFGDKLMFSPNGQYLIFSQSQAVFAIEVLGNAMPRLLIDLAQPYIFNNLAWQPGTSNLIVEIGRFDTLGGVAEYRSVDLASGTVSVLVQAPSDSNFGERSTFSPDRHFATVVDADSVTIVDFEHGSFIENAVTYPAVKDPDSTAAFLPEVTWSGDSQFFMTAVPTPQTVWPNLQLDIYRVKVGGQIDKWGMLPGIYAVNKQPFPTFASDSQQVLYQGLDGLHQLGLNDNQDDLLVPNQDLTWWSSVQLSPDGQQALFSASDGLHWLSLADGRNQIIAPSPMDILGWSSDSHLCALTDGLDNLIFSTTDILQAYGLPEQMVAGVEWLDQDTLVYEANNRLYVQDYGGQPRLIVDMSDALSEFALWPLPPN